jgi:hypothetical protein
MCGSHQANQASAAVDAMGLSRHLTNNSNSGNSHSMKSKKRKYSLVKDNPTIWSKLPRNSEDLMEHLFEKLILDNPKLTAHADKIGCGPYDEPMLKRLSPAQEVFVMIYRLDSQILNGGVTQFCWNAVEVMDEVEAAIKTLKQTDLGKDYEKVYSRLEEKQDEWVDLWNAEEHRAENFSKTYDLLAVRWFDKAYLSKHRAKLIKALLKYVLANKKEFVD